MSDDVSVTELVARFARAEDRVSAAGALARLLGVEEVLLFARDPELGVLLPAPGMPQTVRGGPAFRALLASCADRPGDHRAEVDHPVDRWRPARAHVDPSGVALILLGGEGDAVVLAEVRVLLPLLGAMFGGEHAARLARGEAEVARATGQHAENLALALDATRGDVERALSESDRLNAELQEADRRKDEFMAMLGHELRNPMAAISGAIEVMRARPDDRDQTARARAVIERQTEQLARLVDDLLDVARISRGKIVLKREVLDVESIVRRAVEATHGLAAAKGHEVRVDVRHPVHTHADRTRLEQMVANLLTNAAKYTDPGGHIQVVIDRRADEAIVSVEDDGIGIPPAMLPRIFEAFLQVEGSLERGGGGLGVGLTVVSRLAALHGGRIEARSEVGQGSTFTLHLAAVDGLAAPPPSEAPRSLPPPRRRVLVVDDNADTAEMMVMLAESRGHEAFHAPDGRSGVAMARDLRPDIVLLDIGLPGMDGYEVAARLREDPDTRGARIVAVSGYGQESDRLKSRAAGCDEHLVKPVDFAQLERVLAGG